jgi:tetratricopeptide (TPR) repeat protein
VPSYAEDNKEVARNRMIRGTRSFLVQVAGTLVATSIIALFVFLGHLPRGGLFVCSICLFSAGILCLWVRLLKPKAPATKHHPCRSWGKVARWALIGAVLFLLLGAGLAIYCLVAPSSTEAAFKGFSARAAEADERGWFSEALNLYGQALAESRESGDRPGEGVTLCNMAGVYCSQGRYNQALEAARQGLVIVREVGDRAGEATALNNMALANYGQGKYSEALSGYQQALAIRREVGDRHREGTTLGNIANVYLSQGRYEQALETLTQALAISREAGDRAGEGSALNSMIELARE